MATDWQKAIKKSKDKWSKAKEKVDENRGKGGFGEYDDGKYLARMVKAAGDVNDKGPFIRFDFQFADGEYEGGTKPMFQNLETEENLYYLGRLIETFGYEMPDDLADLQGVLDALNKEKPLCKIRLKTKGDWQNVYVDKVIEADDEDEELEESDEEESDDEEEEESDEEESDEEDEESDEEESDDEEEEDEEESDDEDEVDEDEGVDLEPGMRVTAETAKGPRSGVVHAIDADAGVIKIKDDAGKIFKATPDQVIAEIAPPPTPPAASKPKAKTKAKK